MGLRTFPIVRVRHLIRHYFVCIPVAQEYLTCFPSPTLLSLGLGTG